MSNEKNVVNIEEIVKPMRVTINKTGAVYELDFNRESVRFAEAHGFEPENVAKFPATCIPDLFYYSFRKNHKNVARSQTDSILDTLGGLTSSMLTRLIQLYNQSAFAHVAMEEDMEKNEEATVEL